MQNAGPHALVASWPQLRQQLDRLPLSESAEASNWFAQLLIDTDPFPPPMAAALSAYFHWETDYRAEQVLGTARALALREQLEDLRNTFFPDDAFREHHGQVTLYAALAQALPSWKLRLYALLAPDQLHVQWAALSPRQRYALGIPVDRHNLADLAVGQANIFRLVLALLVLALLAQHPAFFGDQDVFTRALAGLIYGTVGYALLVKLADLSRDAREELQERLLGTREHPPKVIERRAWTAWACLLGATLMTGALALGVMEEALTRWNAYRALAGVITLAALVGMILPPRPAVGVNAAWLATWVACVAGLVALPPAGPLLVTFALLGTTWYGAAALVFTLYGPAIEHRHEEALANATSPWQRRLRHAAWMLGKLSLGWPYTLLNLSQTRSARFVILVVAAGIFTLPTGWDRWLLPYTVLLTVAVLRVDSLLRFFSINAFVPDARSQPALGWAGLVGMLLWAVWGVAWGAEGAAMAAWLGLPAPSQSASAMALAVLLALVLPWLALALLRRAVYRRSWSAAPAQD